MPEYIYALFDFAPENPDEINFKAGDRIEVVEKDDVYGDGWWQVSPPRSAEPSIGYEGFLSPGFRSRWAQMHGGKACSERPKGHCACRLTTSILQHVCA